MQSAAGHCRTSIGRAACNANLRSLPPAGQIPDLACPVPCCRESRAHALQSTDYLLDNGTAMQAEIGR